MSVKDVVVCDLCGRNLDERPVRIVPDAGTGCGLYFYWAESDDVCESCLRKMWLALGRDRGWRATPQRTATAPSVTAAPPAKTAPTSLPGGRGRRARAAARIAAMAAKAPAPETPDEAREVSDE